MLFNHIHTSKGHRGSIYDLILYKGGVISAGGDGYIVFWSAGDGYEIGNVIVNTEAKIFCLELLHNNILLAGDINGNVYWIDVMKKHLLKKVKSHASSVYSIIGIDSFVISGDGSGRMVFWDINKREVTFSIEISTKAIRRFMVLNHKVYASCSDGSIYVIDLTTKAIKLFSDDNHKSSVFSICASANYIYSGGRDAHIHQYDTSGKLVHKVPGHWFTVNDLIMIEEDLLISASRDKNIRAWTTHLEPIETIDIQRGGHINSVNALIYDKEDQLLISASDDRSVKFFKILT